MLDEETVRKGSEGRIAGERRGLCAGETWADWTDRVSRRSSTGSAPDMSVTDIFRRFLLAKAAVDDGLRIEKPSVPNTLLAGFRFTAFGRLGVVGADGIGDTPSLDAMDEVSLAASELPLVRGKGA